MSKELPSMQEIIDRVKKVEREKVIAEFLVSIKKRKLYLEEWQINEIKHIAEQMKEQSNE